MGTKLRKNERNTKEKNIFLFISECKVTSAKPKLRKKLVKAKRFGKINAIRPEIKAKRGRTGKFNLGQIANWGGLVKELGCQIVTQKQGSDAGFSTKQIGAEWRTFHRLFTTRFLFRKLLYFAWRWMPKEIVVLQPKLKKE